jgi:hypothetical protein
LQKLKKLGVVKTHAQEQDQLAREKHEEAVMHSFVEMLPLVRSAFPGHNIVIRPHPSENFETWRTETMSLPNVFVVHEGDVIPWLLAASASIHNGCTTGLQASLLGRPVVSYMLVRSSRFDKDLPNSLSLMARSRDQLIATLTPILSATDDAGSLALTERRRIAEHHISGMSGRWASDRVMDALEELEIGAETLKVSAALGRGPESSRRAQLIKVAASIRNTLRGMLPDGRAPSSGGSVAKNYALQTFPTLDTRLIRQKLKNLDRACGRFSGVQVGQIAENVMCVFPVER